MHSQPTTDLQKHLAALDGVLDGAAIMLLRANNIVYEGFYHGRFPLADVLESLGTKASHSFHLGTMVMVLIAIQKEEDHEKRHRLIQKIEQAFSESGIEIPKEILHEHGKNFHFHPDGRVELIEDSVD